MDAMADQKVKLDASRLWQFPLLIVSLVLFAYAAYLFIDPGKRADVERFLATARGYLQQERPEATVQTLTELLALGRLTPEERAQVHLLSAAAIEQAMKLRGVDIAANHAEIVKQINLAIANGADIGFDGFVRLGRSYEALGKRGEAINAYRSAIAIDSSRELSTHRRIISLLIEQGRANEADVELVKFLNSPLLTESEAAWALGLRGQIKIDAGEFEHARSLLDDAANLARFALPEIQGEIAYRRGYAAWKLGRLDEAHELLTQARTDLTIGNELEADATLALGRIAKVRGESAKALELFRHVITTHPSSQSALLARLDTALIHAALGEDDVALEGFRVVVKELQRRPALEALTAEVEAGIRGAQQSLGSRGNAMGVIELLGYEQSLRPEVTPSFFGRLANALDLRARQVEAAAENAPADVRLKAQQDASDLLTRCGQAWIAYARQLTIEDVAGQAELMWKGIDAFDRAGNVAAAIDALKWFIDERPDDPETPKAILRLGRTYMIAGLFDRAIEAFQRNRFRYPNSLDASKSLVPLAQAYIAKGPEEFAKAEQTLIEVVDNNRLLTPESSEFREAVFELAKLYYRTGRYDQAVVKLEEFRRRYPDDPRDAQLRFLMADSYRRSAGEVAQKLAALDAGADADARPSDRLELVVARRERLQTAARIFGEIVENRAATAQNEAAQLYVKLAHFYQADCLFDLGDFDQAIKLYDVAAFRYQEDPSALAAYVQIVNAHVAMGRPNEARAANERARVLLRRMPADVFSDSVYTIPRAYWEQWLGYSDASGMW